MKDLEKKARAYSLKNALAHNGKAQQGSVVSSLFHEGLKKEDVKKYIKEISKIVNGINSLSIEEQQNEFDKLENIISERESREGLPELPNVPKNGIITRFRPSPSGPLHVGHIISNLISSLYVKKYGGKFYVIIDDTDPTTTIKESYEKIKEDSDWIFGNVYKYINSSDRMELYYKYAKELIKKDAAYVCTCSSEEFKEYTMNLKNCPDRNKGTKENLERWEKMIAKNGFKEGEAILRFKSNMQHRNPAMRDFPLARINETKHPLQGNKYRVWPLMNLVVAVDDMDLGMTHIIRGKDHRDNSERQKMIFKIFGRKYPWCFFMGRIKFHDLVLSKRKITAAIKEGKYKGSEDIRLPTIFALRKRGYKPETFAKFVEQRGLTEVDKVMDSKEFFQVIDNLQ